MSSGSEKRIKTRPIPLRVSPEELAIIDEKARDSGVTRSAFLRAAALGKPVRSNAHLQLVNELRRLGGLLKHQFNESTNRRYSAESAELLRTITDTIARIDADDR